MLPTDDTDIDAAHPGFLRTRVISRFGVAGVIRYAGTYRFEDRDVLHRALAAARAQLDDDDELAALAGGWLRCFVMHGTTLMVNIALPALPEHRFAAASVFTTLSRDAIAGSVKATIGDVGVDEYLSGDED